MYRIEEIRQYMIDTQPKVEEDYATQDIAKLRVCCKRALSEVDRLRAERDALTELINSQTSKPIEDCKHYDSCYKEAYDAFKPLQCPICRKWELRGLEGQNEADT